jgi:hypothetical protein
MNSSSDKYFDLKSLSEYSSLGVPTLRDYIRSEGLPCFKVKGKILVRQSEFDGWLESFRVDTNCQLREHIDSLFDSLKN